MDWVWIWAVTLGAGAIGHVLLAWSHRHVEAWLGSLITQCMPIVSSVAAWVLLGETLTPLTIVGRPDRPRRHGRRSWCGRRSRATDDTFDVAPESPAPAGW